MAPDVPAPMVIADADKRLELRPATRGCEVAISVAPVAAAEFFLERNVSMLDASDEELEQLTLAVAEGKVAVEALAIWFRQRLRTAE